MKPDRLTPIEIVPIDSIVPNPHNPRQNDAARMELLELSVSRFGFVLPLYIHAEGEIASGHQRHTIAKRLGMTHVPVIRCVEMNEGRTLAINSLLNRATNDTEPTDTAASMTSELLAATDQIEMIRKLPYKNLNDPKSAFPCIQNRTLVPIENFTKRHHDSASVLVVSELYKKVPHMPLVVNAETGEVINGRSRLEWHRRNNQTHVEVVSVSDELANATAMLLNNLSMDFAWSERYMEMMRWSQFRRRRLVQDRLNRTWVYEMLRQGKGQVPSKLNTNSVKIRLHGDKDEVVADPKHRAAFHTHYGKKVLDFGAGQLDQSRIMTGIGVEVTSFEPFLLRPGTEVLWPEGARDMGRQFLDRVGNGYVWDTIGLASVLNSVPFYEDREHIIRIVAALCHKHRTKVIALSKGGFVDTARPWTAFEAPHEEGVSINARNRNPQTQKFFVLPEWQQLWQIGFRQVEAKTWGDMVCARATKPRPPDPAKLVAALNFEFDLAYPDQRLGLAEEAREAFGRRLGMDLSHPHPETTAGEKTPPQQKTPETA